MSYEIAIAVSTVLISFILIYISTMLNKKDYPGFQFMFFSAGLIFMIITIFVCVSIATAEANTDLMNMLYTAMTGMVFLFLLVIVFFFFKYWGHLMKGMAGKNDDDDDE
jgi:UDP-N-acetylmuramyl pentapeptide phosphotransferase/UDP-N-acetylglucosamine-1-phosphate transferase